MKSFSGKIIAIKMKKTKVAMNLPVHLDFIIFHLINRETYSFWYDYVKIDIVRESNCIILM